MSETGIAGRDAETRDLSAEKIGCGSEKPGCGSEKAGRVELKLDLHAHTNYSVDCLVRPDTVIRLAKERGFHGVAITDHNTAAGAFKAVDEANSAEFAVIPGIEYATDQGHVVGLFIVKQPDVPDAAVGDKKRLPPIGEIVSAIHDAGGIAVLAHPFQSRSVLPPGLPVDAVEGFNSRAEAVGNPQANSQAKEYARDNGLALVGGSDAHFPWDVGRAGCVIKGLAPGSSPVLIKKAVLEGRAEVFGRSSHPGTIPLAGLIKVTRTRRLSQAPKYIARLLLSLLGPVGRPIEKLGRSWKQNRG